MPATAIDPEKAVVIHSQVDVDADPVMRYGETGLILNAVSYTPTREKKEKTDHRGRKIAALFVKPEFKLALDAEVLQLAALLAAPHPASALSLDEVASFFPDVACGFPTDQGYCGVESNTLGGRAGDFYKADLTLELWWLPSDAVDIVRAA